MKQGDPVCDLLVLNPIESVWCQVHIGWAENLGPKAPEIKKLEDQYTQLFYCCLLYTSNRLTNCKKEKRRVLFHLPIIIISQS